MNADVRPSAFSPGRPADIAEALKIAMAKKRK